MLESEYRMFGAFRELIVGCCNQTACMSIIPEYGAVLRALKLTDRGVQISILDSAQTDEQLRTDPWFKSAILAPFPGRIDNGRFAFRKSDFQLPINFTAQNHAIHGLVYDKPFQIHKISASSNASEVAFMYAYDGCITGFPFPFSLLIRYSLTGQSSFSCSIEATNTGRIDMPFGAGWHPYFTLGCSVNDLFLKFPKCRQLELNDRLLPTGKLFEFPRSEQFFQMASDHFDSTFQLSACSTHQTAILQNRRDGIELQIQQENGRAKFNFLQAFTPPSRKSIALEPMSCAGNSFNNKIGLIELAPQEKFSASCNVRLVVR